MDRPRYSSALALLALSALAGPAAAQTPLTTELVATGFAKPLWAGAPRGDARVFVVEQNSRRIEVVVNGVVQATPFLNLTKANTGGNERGVLGMTFHPDFANNGYFYVQYTANQSPGKTVIERFTASPPNSNTALLSTGKLIFEVAQPFSNHNAGALAFGPDGYLYIPLGDGGSGGDPGCRAQKPGVALGKLLRVDVDTGPGVPYVVPADNPFVNDPAYLPEIWALGLRNPWRISFDSETGDLWIGDVGQSSREEINFAPAGAAGLNYGWKIMEGTNCFSTAACGTIVGGVPPCNSPLLTDPILDYPLGANGCVVVGGFVYRGCAIPDLQGTYIYADYCSSRIWSFEQSAGAVVNFQERTVELKPSGTAIKPITSLGEDGFGEILLVDGSNPGQVWRIVPNAPVAGTDCDDNGQIDDCEIAGDPVLDLDLDGGLDICQELSADVATVSLSAGGLQSLSLHPGAAHAGALYFLLGSASGTSPGIAIDGQTLPLNFDGYFNLTLKAGPLPLQNSLGFLDAAGNASAGFLAPPAAYSPSLAGVTLNHAYAVIGITVTTTSNPIPVLLVP